MRRYKAIGLAEDGAAGELAEVLRRRLGEETPFRIVPAEGEVQVVRSADPLRVTLAIEGAGFRVVNVSG